MMHRFLLCIALFSIVASAQPDSRSSAGANAESWSFGFGSEEGSGHSSYMGIDIADVTTERLSALKLKEEHGAEITMVDADAPAGKAGLREHNVILSVNGTSIESAAQLRRIIKETPPGRVVTLGISRDGQLLTIKVQLADRTKSTAWKPGEHEFNFQMPELPALPDFDLPVSVVIAHSSMRSGLMVENLTPQLGEFFGAKDGKGVLVRSVEKGSRGEKAGFRAGDVIVKVNAQPVHDASDFTHALRGSSNKPAAVTIIRDKHEQNITLSLPEKKDSGFLIQEDSFEIPEISEEADHALQLADREIANLDTKKLAQDMAKANDALQETQRCLQERQREIQDRLKGQQQKMLEQSQRLREQGQRMKEQGQRMQEQQRKLRHDLARQWAEI